MLVDEPRPSGTARADLLVSQRRPPVFELSQCSMNGAACEPRRVCNRRHASIAQRPRFDRRGQASLAFIEVWQQARQPFPDSLRTDHGCRVPDSPELYKSFCGGPYGAVLQHILRASGPTLYHCSAGKDRTGTFTALLLRMLGVPLETVFEDYLLTNRYFGTDERIASLAKDLKSSPETARPMYVADRSYLEAAFQAIDRTYGSFDNYRRTALKLLDADLERLKARLLED